jgi:lipopolysaccharide/colanic/teichoic acid biosynthesis glycosyltransferase
MGVHAWIDRNSLAAGTTGQAHPRLFGAAVRPDRWDSLVANLGNGKQWYQHYAGQGAIAGAGYERVKRLFDLAVSLALLPFALAIVALCALAIRLDTPGPAYFHQLRTGKGGRRFKMYKLRTMVQNAEELKAQLLPFNELTYPDFKIANDPRITRVGRFLRRTSLDELPQLLNVIRGDMTLVGPRPTSFAAETYSLWHTARLEVKPGLTGLWQVSGRNELDFDDRLRLDIAYVRNRCLRLDFKILLRTAGAVLNGRGAN